MPREDKVDLPFPQHRFAEAPVLRMMGEKDPEAFLCGKILQPVRLCAQENSVCVADLMGVRSVGPISEPVFPEIHQHGGAEASDHKPPLFIPDPPVIEDDDAFIFQRL